MLLQKCAWDHRGLTDQRLFEFRVFRKNRHPFLLQPLAVEAIDERDVNDAGLDGLGLDALVSDGLQQDLIALRLQSKMLQPEHGAHPSSPAETIDGDSFL